MWVAAKPTLDITKGKCSLISTPSLVGTHFHKTYVESSNVGGKNSFHSEKLP